MASLKNNEVLMEVRTIDATMLEEGKKRKKASLFGSTNLAVTMKARATQTHVLPPKKNGVLVRIDCHRDARGFFSW